MTTSLTFFLSSMDYHWHARETADSYLVFVEGIPGTVVLPLDLLPKNTHEITKIKERFFVRSPEPRRFMQLYFQINSESRKIRAVVVVTSSKYDEFVKFFGDFSTVRKSADFISASSILNNAEEIYPLQQLLKRSWETAEMLAKRGQIAEIKPLSAIRANVKLEDDTDVDDEATEEIKYYKPPKAETSPPKKPKTATKYRVVFREFNAGERVLLDDQRIGKIIGRQIQGSKEAPETYEVRVEGMSYALYFQKDSILGIVAE